MKFIKLINEGFVDINDDCTPEIRNGIWLVYDLYNNEFQIPQSSILFYWNGKKEDGDNYKNILNTK